MNTTNKTQKVEEKVEKKEKSRRIIPGNLPYSTSPGVLKRVVEKIPISERPPIFSRDFLGTVMEATGGSAMPIVPILKRLGFLSDGGVPTEIYSQFQTDSGRANAALAALRQGYVEIFNGTNTRTNLAKISSQTSSYR